MTHSSIPHDDMAVSVGVLKAVLKELGHDEEGIEEGIEEAFESVRQEKYD